MRHVPWHGPDLKAKTVVPQSRRRPWSRKVGQEKRGDRNPDEEALRPTKHFAPYIFTQRTPMRTFPASVLLLAILAGCTKDPAQKSSPEQAQAPPASKPVIEPTNQDPQPTPTPQAGKGKPTPAGKKPTQSSKSPKNRPVGPDCSNADVLAICELLASDPEKNDRDEALDRLEKLNPGLFKYVVAMVLEKPGSVEHQRAIDELRFLGGTLGKGADAMPLVMKEWKRLTKSCGKETGHSQRVVLGALLVNTARTMMTIACGDRSPVIDAIAAAATLPDAADGQSMGHVRYAMFQLLTPPDLEDEAAIKYVLPAFIAGIRDSDKAVRAAVIRSIGDFGPLAKDAIEPLRPMRFDEIAEVRAAAIDTLKKISE